MKGLFQAEGITGDRATGVWLGWMRMPHRPYWVMYMVLAMEFEKGFAVRVSDPWRFTMGMN